MRLTGAENAARASIGIAALVLCGALAPGFSQQKMAQAPMTITSIPRGTVIPVRLNVSLASNQSRVGDRFSATVASDKQGYSSYKGVQVEGVVTGVTIKDGSKAGTLRLKFDTVRGLYGRVITFNGIGAPLTGDNFNLKSTPYHVKNMNLTGQFVGSDYDPIGGHKGHDMILKRGELIAVVAR